MNRNFAFILVVIVGITGLLLAGKFLAPHHAVTAQIDGGRLTTGKTTGATAPNFELKVVDANGKTMKLADLRGKGVILDFWATYCEPCKIEMPWFVELQKKYGPQGLQIVGVDYEDVDEKTVSDFTKKMGINYPIVIGTDNVIESYGGLQGLPMTFFIDRSGKIIDRELGLISESVIEDNIKKSLQGGSSSTASAQ